MLHPRLLTLVGIILTAAISRLLPHPPNFTPIGAIALFGGAYLDDKRLSFLVPAAAMLLSDLILGVHRLMPVVYGSCALTVCIGLWLRTRRSGVHIVGAVVVSSVLFFIVTNFGVWAMGSLYPRTIEGLVACYVAAIPFFRNELLGTSFYTALLFGGFHLTEWRFPALREGSPRA